MKLKVLRFSSQEDSTSGLLFHDSPGGLEFLCYTLEDEYRVLKIRGETRIPAGTYKVILRNVGRIHERYAKRFPDIHRGTLHVIDVPNFKWILIHCGNNDDHTAGCLLLGDSQENNQIIKDGFIGKSRNAYKRVYQPIAKAIEKGEEVTIEYIDLDRKEE